MTRQALALSLLLGLALPAAGQDREAAEAAERMSQAVGEDGLPLGVRAVVGPPQGPKLSGTTLELRTNEVGGLLRCPMCQGLSVADSRAGIAVNMKRQVGQLLAAGYTEEQILAYFERSYGEFVRLEPPMRGINWLVWLAPLGGLALGVGVLGWALRRSQAAASPEPDATPPAAAPAAEADADVPGRDALPDDPTLAKYVLQVRELAYGWPGGRPPEERS